MSQHQTLAVLMIMISPAIGSFIAVLADRLPRREDWLTAPSHCRSCDTRLGPSDLIPLVSFITRKGRCKYCHTAIPPVTLYAELLALGAAILAVLAGGGAGVMVLSALWLWLMLALALTDVMWLRLPDGLTLLASVLALGTSMAPQGIGIENALWGAVLGAGSFAVLRWGYTRLRGRVGLGLGDVKLMAGLGAFAGPALLPHLVLVAALAALGGAFLTRGDTVEGFSRTRALPFGAALCASAAALWFWRAVT